MALTWRCSGRGQAALRLLARAAERRRYAAPNRSGKISPMLPAELRRFRYSSWLEQLDLMNAGSLHLLDASGITVDVPCDRRN